MCYIIDNALPLTTVETLSFRNLFKNTNLRVMSHAKLKSRLDERFEQMLGNIKKLLASQKYVCITTDICSNSSECKYFGYSCHWLDKKYQRHSVALACRRFSGDHAQILEMISKINDDYEFNNLKIVGAITNNDTNCTKAFQEFGIDLRRDAIVEDESSYEAHKELRELICDALPNRMQCTGEILNLLASTDFLELLSKDKNLKERHLKVCKAKIEVYIFLILFYLFRLWPNVVHCGVNVFVLNRLKSLPQSWTMLWYVPREVVGSPYTIAFAVYCCIRTD